MESATGMEPNQEVKVGGQAVGPGGPGRNCCLQGSGPIHDKWNGGAKAPPSTGLGGSIRNLNSGETACPGVNYDIQVEQDRQGRAYLNINRKGQLHKLSYLPKEENPALSVRNLRT